MRTSTRKITPISIVFIMLASFFVSAIPAAAAAPTITSITPSSGTYLGGTEVTIVGTNLTGASVTFGGVAGTDVVVVSATTIRVKTPAGNAGEVDVIVTNSDPASVTEAAGFTYTGSITASPTSSLGLASTNYIYPVGTDGISIEFTAVGFAAPTWSILTGGAAATLANGFSSSEAAGKFIISGDDVTLLPTTQYTIRATNGDYSVSYTISLTVAELPTVQTIRDVENLTSTSVSLRGTIDPKSISTNALFCYGTNPTLFGNPCIPASPTSVSGSGVASVSVNLSSLTASTVYYFAVKAVNGATGADGLLGAIETFTTSSAPAPTVTSMTPTSGVLAGGTSVTITGTNFTNASSVTFDGVAGTGLVVNSATSITVLTPARATAGAVNVIVTTPGGSSTATTAAQRFTYGVAPTVTSMTPTSGPLAGGTTVTITGTGFTGATGVTFGGTAGTGLVVNSATSITIVTPAATSAGAVNVVVTTPEGSSTATTSSQRFTYGSAPTVSGVSPSSGTIAGGTSVTLTGTNFTGATGVTFGGTAGTGLVVNSATSITIVTPAATSAGAVNVVVTTPSGSSTATTSSQRFTYVALPTITAISPVSGPLAGGTTVTITGENLTGATNVTFGGTAGSNISVNSAGTSLTVRTPLRTQAGIATVRVITPAGGVNSTDTGNQVFTYIAPPATPTGVSATAGPLRATVTWTAVTGATSYTVTSTPAGGSCAVTNNTATCTNLTAGTGYTFQVVANGAGGASAASTASNRVVPTAAVTITSKKITVTFAGTSVTVPAARVTAIRALAAQIKAEKGTDIKIAINGFTVATGATAADQTRALARANAVRKVVRTAGVRGTFTVTATGKAKTIAKAQKAVLTITWSVPPK